MMTRLDGLDYRMLAELVRNPRAQIGELCAALSVARNTVQSRLKRLTRAEVLRSGGRDVDVGALGLDVVSFVTIEVSHRELDDVISALRALPQVLEVFEISGRGDLWCRLAARDTEHLQSGLRAILRIKGVVRTETSLALYEHIPYRLGPLLDRLAS